MFSTQRPGWPASRSASRGPAWILRVVSSAGAMASSLLAIVATAPPKQAGSATAVGR